MGVVAARREPRSLDSKGAVEFPPLVALFLSTHDR